ncbi:MAG TPA: glycoside hydrolase family 15 protein [Gemmatimonadaceae bacterium]|nr:glycoside hydrolase family 15 protein [Gemmatimonadaceae bacterium]
MTIPAWAETSQPWRLSESGDYPPISAYALVGDMHTAALVALNGSIDWCCLPRFDSPSVFAAILDAAKGGSFQIAPSGRYTSEQRYLPATAVVVTTFRTEEGGVVELTDFMPVGRPEKNGRRAELHRRVRCTRGEAEVIVRFRPRFDYGASTTLLFPRANGVIATDGDDESLALAAPRSIWWHLENATAHATLKLAAEEEHWFVLRYDDDEVNPLASYGSEASLAETIAFWDRWVAKITYEGPYRVPVERSAITLKLMCYEPTGAIVAAPTMSLPEELGGIRNWDYRYSWLRDSAFVLYSFHVLGHYDEADRFMSFLKRITRKATDAHLQIMYGIDGRRELTERTLEHLEGYRRSAPVRVGNGAYDQVQLDVYGEVLETAWLWSRHHTISEGTWATLQRLVSWIADHWTMRDSGIWEVRAGPQHYVLSKVMCWVALDRGIRLAQKFDLPADLDRWRRERDAVHADVMARGWSEEKQSFVQYYGTDALDASNLIIPMVHFLPRDHPRVVGTVMATLRELTSDDQELVFRYRNDDGLPGEEGVFSICTFWLAETLAMCGEMERAERIFQRMLRHANHVGLYSEELHPTSGEFLGNFPQAFTHIALINCASVFEKLKARREPDMEAGV